MTAEAEIIEKLLATEAITDLGPTDSIRPGILGPDDDLPAIMVRLISKTPSNTMEGVDLLATCFWRVEVSCWAETYKAASDLSEAVEDALNGFTGDGTDHKIEMCHLELSRYERGDLLLGDEKARHAFIQDYLVSGADI